ncbi:type I 3-dehydroquinate dehydratase [Caldivirga maquilingensis]|uniref:type I 3-dehydroquinate dehydratase n=1 Tax=Caldivirga maquilingensis TaxID=76887 RepID=UPI0018DD51FB|nr:type I 3-dehydroquinate dehydratase [Caldivirga maquilingensis]
MRYTLEKAVNVHGIVFGDNNVIIAAPVISLKGFNDISEIVNIAKEKGIHILEIRYDYLLMENKDLSPSNILLQLNNLGFPYIFTFRSPREGGVYEIPDHLRLKMILDIIVKYKPTILDVELYVFKDPEMRYYASSILKYSKDEGIGLIVSYHDFNNTPDYDTLYRIGEEEAAVGADILKIATMARDFSDIITMLRVTHDLRAKLRKPLITLTMGERGKVGRVLTPIFGSDLVFVDLMGKSASGQIPLSHMLDFVRIMGEL